MRSSSYQRVRLAEWVRALCSAGAQIHANDEPKGNGGQPVLVNQYKRKATSTVISFSIGWPSWSAGLNFQRLTAATAFSSRPYPTPFTTLMSRVVPSTVTVSDNKTVPLIFFLRACSVYSGSGMKIACGG